MNARVQEAAKQAAKEAVIATIKREVAEHFQAAYQTALDEITSDPANIMELIQNEAHKLAYERTRDEFGEFQRGDKSWAVHHGISEASEKLVDFVEVPSRLYTNEAREEMDPARTFTYGDETEVIDDRKAWDEEHAAIEATREPLRLLFAKFVKVAR